ncbi:MAG: hypothetical protein ACI976_001913 [Aureispira sp.]|jgi:hypothetical protein
MALNLFRFNAIFILLGFGSIFLTSLGIVQYTEVPYCR